MAITAIVVTIFTGVLTWVGVEQWRLLRLSIQESSAALEIARKTAEATNSVASGTVMTGAATLDLANAASRSAEAAAKSLAITQDVATRQLRAYVAQVDGAATDFLLGERPIIGLRLANYGKTPAYDVRVIHSLNADHGSSPNSKFKFRNILRSGPYDLAPSQVTKVRVNANVLSQGELDMILSGSMCVIHAGIVTYMDAFGKRRRVVFKNYLYPGSIEGSGKATMVMCRKGNRSS